MKSLFLVALGLSLLVDLALGAWAGVNFPHFAKTWGLSGVAPAGVAPPDVARFLSWVLGTCLVGFAAIQGIAFHWARRDKDEGPQLAIGFGCWLVISSLLTYAFVMLRGAGSDFATMGWKFLVVDGLRGAALMVLGIVALRTPSVVRELRLPDGARLPRRREEGPGSRPQRRDDRPRRRDEGRESRVRGERARPSGGREGRERDERRPPSSAGHGRQRGDAPLRGQGARRREDASPDARPPMTGRPSQGARRLPSKGETPSAAGLERRAVAKARRISPKPVERPLTVVVRGAPERIRALAPDERRLAEALPIVPPSVPPPGGVSPSGGAEAIVAEDGAGRRRRRRRRRGGAGSAEPSFGEGSSSADYENLDEPVVLEREIEERAGEGSGEGQEGMSAVRGRNRRRRNRSGPAEPSAEPAELDVEPEVRPGRHASAVEAFDMLRLLEPEDSGSPAPASGRR